MLPGNGLSFNVTEMQQMVAIGETDGKNAAATLASSSSSGLPATCTIKTAKVACGSDKDCFNWGVEKCASLLSKTSCDHDSRQCVFTQ